MTEQELIERVKNSPLHLAVEKFKNGTNSEKQ